MSRRCAETEVTRAVRGSWCRSSASLSSLERVCVLKEISVPPDSRWTKEMSLRLASAVARAPAASGVQRSRIVQAL
ncbi:hypothetical protein ACFXPQ_11020 [Streptomyces lydicus]|uniref:hypothetical protein n=1 Tax=Streptomyces lydicus TaxID=47763 RepID=UPI00369B262C